MTGSGALFLWYESGAEAAAAFYAETFPDSRVTAIHPLSGEEPGHVQTVEFTVLGIRCVGFNGGPYFKLNEACSLQLATETQKETDRLWNALMAAGGSEGRCGWCKDKWGLSWQIIPRALSQGLADPDPAARSRVFEAMMTMGKIDIAAIEAARRG
jgi:2-polyprenyl-6-hydroxyphenyl methylase/3-demethylubiquinone-9 3-methyltransferase